MVTQAERIARKRIDALKIPRLDGMSVRRVDKINDTEAASMTVARAGPGWDELPLTPLMNTAPVTKNGKPALVFGGGATCDNAVGRQIERTTKEVWEGEPLIGARKKGGPKPVVCNVWHLQGGGFVAPAPRRGSPAFLTHWPEDRRSTEFVIHVPEWAELPISWVVYAFFGLIACGFLWLIYMVSDINSNYPKAIPPVDVRPNLFQTAEEAQKSMAEEVTAPEHVPLSSFQVGGLLIFFCAVILEFWVRENFNTSLDVLVSAMARCALAMVRAVAEGVAAIAWRVIEPFKAVLSARWRRGADAAAVAAADAAAADLLADEPAPRDDARALRRRAPRGRRRERTRGATPSAKEPAPAVAVPESKPEAPVAPESKSEAPPAAPEAKAEEEEEPAAQPVPRGYENVARVLAHLDEARLLPLFEAQRIHDAALSTLEPSTLVELGVPPMVCLALSGAAASGKAKKLEADDLLDGVAKHQSVLEEALREHRAELARLKISSASELPEDLCCPITTELMSEPVVCVGDGNTYERAAIEQWFATGARTSPTTNAQLDSTTLVPNLTVKRLIAAELERRGRTV